MTYHLKVFLGEKMKGLKERKNKRRGDIKRKKERKKRREGGREEGKKESRIAAKEGFEAVCQYEGDYVPHK